MATVTVGSAGESVSVEYSIAPKVLYGANDSHFDALNASLGGNLAIRRFYEDQWPAAPTAREQEDFNRGVLPWVSFSGPSPSAITSGSYDANLIAYFKSSTKPKLITYLHEVDNKKASPADFRAAMKHLYDLKQKHCPIADKVLLGPILTGWAFTTGGAQNFMDFMTPGSMDFIGTDPYRFWRPPVQADGVTTAPVDPKSGSYGTKRSMQYLCSGVSQGQQLVPYAKSLGIPIAVGEYSAHPDPRNVGDRPAWLQETHEFFERSGVRFACFFHGPWGESGPWWLDRFHTFSPHQGDAARLLGGTDTASLSKFREILEN